MPSGGGVASSISPVEYDAVISPIADGVGVMDGGSESARSSRLRFRCGVLGGGGSLHTRWSHSQ